MMPDRGGSSAGARLNGPPSMRPVEIRRDWLGAQRLYLAVLVPGMLVWEAAQMPLYTLWWTGTTAEIGYAILHCTLGDALIGVATLGCASLLVGSSDWPHERFAAVAVVTLTFGLAWVVYSEWVDVELRGSWAHTETMPRIPPLGTGPAPLLQWLVVPAMAFAVTHRVLRSGSGFRPPP